MTFSRYIFFINVKRVSGYFRIFNYIHKSLNDLCLTRTHIIIINAKFLDNFELRKILNMTLEMDWLKHELSRTIEIYSIVIPAKLFSRTLLNAIPRRGKVSHSSDSVAWRVLLVPAQKHTNCHLVRDNATSLAPSMFLRVPRCLPRECITRDSGTSMWNVHRDLPISARI